MKYVIKKVFKYTETVEVRADGPREAKDIAMQIDGEHNNDDCLYDCVVLSCSQELPVEPPNAK